MRTIATKLFIFLTISSQICLANVFPGDENSIALEDGSLAQIVCAWDKASLMKQIRFLSQRQKKAIQHVSGPALTSKPKEGYDRICVTVTLSKKTESSQEEKD